MEHRTETGPLVDTLMDHLGWLRLPNNSSIFEHFSDPASGNNTADFELLFVVSSPAHNDLIN